MHHGRYSILPSGVSVDEPIAVARPLRFRMFEDVDELDLLEKIVSVNRTGQVVEIVGIERLYEKKKKGKGEGKENVIFLPENSFLVD